MDRLCLVLLATASAALASTVTSTTDCYTLSGCTTSTLITSFSPTYTLEGRADANVTGIADVPHTEYSKTITSITTFFTDGPPRPGYLDLSFSGWADGSLTPGAYYSRIWVTGLYSMACFATGCYAPHTVIPVELGGTIEIVIAVRSTHGFVGYGYYGGVGVMSYSLQVRDSTFYNQPVLMYSTPEPRAQGLIGLLLLCAAAAVKRLRRRAASDPVASIQSRL